MKALDISSLSSHILIIGEKNQKLFHWPVDFVHDFPQAQHLMRKQSYSVAMILCPPASYKETEDFLSSLPHETRVILRSYELSSDFLFSIAKKRPHIRILDKESDMERLLESAWEEVKQEEQDKSLKSLLQDEQKELQEEIETLDEKLRVSKVSLEKTQEKQEKHLYFLSLQQECLVKIHRSMYYEEIESSLNHLFTKKLGLSWMKIDLFSQDVSLKKNQTFKTLKFPLQIEEAPFGSVVFAKKRNEHFSSAEKNLFLEVSEALALSIDRQNKLMKSEAVRIQWDSTFHAVLHPLCITDDKFLILQANQAFLDKTKKKIKNIRGKPVSQVFLEKDCDFKKLSSAQKIFRFSAEDKSRAVYDTYGQHILLAEKWFESNIYLLLFRDVTGERSLEEKMIKSSQKMEEAIISSSIAHEINNPLGAILSFIQLLKMQNKDPDLKDDLSEMEKAAFRSRDIVVELLEFLRKDD